MMIMEMKRNRNESVAARRVSHDHHCPEIETGNRMMLQRLAKSEGSILNMNFSVGVSM